MHSSVHPSLPASSGTAATGAGAASTKSVPASMDAVFAALLAGTGAQLRSAAAAKPAVPDIFAQLLAANTKSAQPNSKAPTQTVTLGAGVQAVPDAKAAKAVANAKVQPDPQATGTQTATAPSATQNDKAAPQIKLAVRAANPKLESPAKPAASPRPPAQDSRHAEKKTKPTPAPPIVAQLAAMAAAKPVVGADAPTLKPVARDVPTHKDAPAHKADADALPQKTQSEPKTKAQNSTPQSADMPAMPAAAMPNVQDAAATKTPVADGLPVVADAVPQVKSSSAKPSHQQTTPRADAPAAQQPQSAKSAEPVDANANVAPHAAPIAAAVASAAAAPLAQLLSGMTPAAPAPAPVPSAALPPKPAAARSTPAAQPAPQQAPAATTPQPPVQNAANSHARQDFADDRNTAQQPTTKSEVPAPPHAATADAQPAAIAAPAAQTAASTTPHLDASTNAVQAAASVTVPNTTAPVAATLHVAPQTAATAQPDFGAVAITIAAKSRDGEKHFDIRLDPPELGRIDVHLSFDDAGKAQAHLTADKPQTLQLLQNDRSTLERALKESGFDLSNNGLNFSLKGQDRQQDGGSAPRGRAHAITAIAAADAVASTAAASSYQPGGDVRLDIRV